jgi:hypothetical protein
MASLVKGKVKEDVKDGGRTCPLAGKGRNGGEYWCLDGMRTFMSNIATYNRGRVRVAASGVLGERRGQLQPPR